MDGVFEGEAEMDAAGSVQKRHRDSRCVESGLVGSGSGPGPGPGSGCLEGGVSFLFLICLFIRFFLYFFLSLSDVFGYSVIDRRLG